MTCSDLKLLSKYVERHAINFYGPLLCYDQPTFITLSWIKLIFEDIIEFAVQLTFILHIQVLYLRNVDNENEKRFENGEELFEKPNNDIYQILLISICFTGSSILSSFITIYFKQTSRLSKDDLAWVKMNILVNAFDQRDDLSDPYSHSSEMSEESKSEYCKFTDHLCLNTYKSIYSRGI